MGSLILVFALSFIVDQIPSKTCTLYQTVFGLYEANISAEPYVVTFLPHFRRRFYLARQGGKQHRMTSMLFTMHFTSAGFDLTIYNI